MQHIYKYGKELSDDVKKKKLGAVEALARLADFAWFQSGKESHTFIWGMTQLLNGWDINVSDYAFDNLVSRISTTNSGKRDTPQTKFYLFSDAFGFGEKEALEGISDWAPQYYDGTKGQPYHFWAYVAIAEKNGQIIANYAVNEHDPPNSPHSFGIQTSKGFSQEDYALGVVAIEFYQVISSSYPVPQNPGTWIRNNLKSSPANGY